MSIISESATSKKSPLQIENIPTELREQRRWVVWHWSYRDGDKPTKVPLDAQALIAARDAGEYPTHIRASSVNPHTWCDFSTAVRALDCGADGLGYMLGDGWCGIDWDGVISVSGNIDFAARMEAEQFNSYTEISPSGRGIKAIVKATVGKGRKHGHREIYSDARFFTLTGNKTPWSASDIREQQARAERFVAAHFPGETPRIGSPNISGLNIADADILRLARAAKNSAKFSALYDADEKAICGFFAKPDGSPDWSSAVASLMSILAFYTQDHDQLERIYLSSALAAQWAHKWDRLGPKLIHRAVNNLTSVYMPSATDEAAALQKLGDEAEKLIGYYEPPTPDIKPAPAIPPPAPAPESDIDTAALAQAAATASIEKAERSKIRVLRRSDLRLLPRPSWLVQKHITANSVGVVYGPYGAAKSFYCLDLALSIANEKPFLGQYRVHKGRVAYCAGEGAWGIDGRLTAWEQHHALPMTPDDCFALVPDVFDMLSESHIEEASKTLRRAFPHGLDMLFVDTMARYFGAGDENSSRDMSGFVNNAFALAKLLDCCLVVVHHTGKDASKKTRGSVVLPCGCDWAIELTGSPDEGVRVRCEKQKDAPKFETYGLLGMTVETPVGSSLVLDYVPPEKKPAAEPSPEEVERHDRHKFATMIGRFVPTNEAEARPLKQTDSRSIKSQNWELFQGVVFAQIRSKTILSKAVCDIDIRVLQRSLAVFVLEPWF